MDFDVKIARRLLDSGRETCGPEDVERFVLESITSVREFCAFVMAEPSLKRWHDLVESEQDYDLKELFEAVAELVGNAMERIDMEENE